MNEITIGLAIAGLALIGLAVVGHLNTKRRAESVQSIPAMRDSSVRNNSHKIPDGSEIPGPARLHHISLDDKGMGSIRGPEAPGAWIDEAQHFVDHSKIVTVANRNDFTADLYMRADGTLARLQSVEEVTANMDNAATRRWIECEANRLEAEAITLLRLLEQLKETK